MKKNLSLLLAAALSAGALSAAAETAFAWKSSANAPALRFIPNPDKLNALPQITIDNKKVARLDKKPGSQSATAYQYAEAMIKRFSAPGTLLMKVNGKFTGNISKASLIVNYNLAKGGNASAGSENFNLKTSNAFQTYQHAFTVPSEAARIQYAISFYGAEGSAFDIANVTLEYAPDKVKVVSSTPQKNLKPSRWRNIPAAYGFFDPATLQLAAVRTANKVMFDKDNLYVGFIADEPEMANISEKITQRDGSLWNDDCVEFIFYDPASDKAKHFIVNPANARFDCERVQAQPGDPYKDKPWDGEWSSQVWKNSDSWEVVMTIPWKTLGLETIPDYPVRVNFMRERFQGGQLSHWNCYVGSFADIENHGTLDFKKGEMVRARKMDKISYTPKRARKVFDKIVKKAPYNWGSWHWSNEFQYGYHEPRVRKKFTHKEFAEYQKKMLDIWAEAGTSAVRLDSLLPPAKIHHTTTLPLQYFIDANKKSGIQFPYILGVNSTMLAKKGAMPSLPANLPGKPGRFTIDPAHPSAATYIINDRFKVLAGEIRKNPDIKNMIAYLQGFDEPCNHIRHLYSRTHNADQKEWLDKFEKELINSTGFGKFGLHDDFGKANNDDAFRRIAFWRWWNNCFADYTARLKKAADELLPGIPFQVFNRNSCAAHDQIDIALCGNRDFIISCDPYPTSARAQFGMPRALYHTGFEVKMLNDLAPKAKIAMFGQCFNYWHGTPTYADVREWTSQALKNGLDYLRWYGSGVITKDKQLNTEVYNASLEIGKQLKNIRPLELPTATATAIFYSDYDRWALDERPTHAAYTVYSLLAEHINCNFRFVSKHNFDLENIRLLYIPRMRFTDPELTAKLVKFTENGGTLVVFDPDFLRYNIDGTSVPEREKFLGGKLVAKTAPGTFLVYKKQRMPIYKVQHAKTPENDTVYAFDIEKLPAGARILAAYSDKTPAIIERSFGKGRIIFSCVMPFGTSDVALTPVGWKQFVCDRAKEVKEKTNLDIWFFELPEIQQKTFNVKQLR